VEAAGHCFATGAPQLLQYGITNERAWEVGLACGGRLTVFLEPVR
jgi:xanthine dehydrogenase accessory factor